MWGDLAIDLEAGDWIFAGSFDGWIETEDNSYNEGDGTGDAEDFPGDMWCKWGNK